MVLDIILLFIYLFTPSHDFHTSWMTFNYNEKDQVFECEWRTDTEHLEGALTDFSGKEIRLENDSIKNYILLIDKYIHENTALYLNDKSQDLKVTIIEVNFSETTVHFKSIKCKRKLKSVEMLNTLLVSKFPNQSNMVQLNYKGQKYSMLFDYSKAHQKITIIE